MTFDDATQAFFDYMDPHLDARMGQAGSDMLSSLVNGEIGDRPLSRREAMDLSVQILIAGVDTVVNFLGFAFLFLARSPGHRQQLIDEPDLIPAAVDELFRRFPVVSVGREVRYDMVYEGVTLRQGDVIILPTPLHGMDERDNAAALDVDFRRSHAEHTSFGNGAHRCPGAHLARTEMTIVIREWLARIPHFQIDDSVRLTYRGGIVGVLDRLPLIW
jgi:cytochrome P450